MCLEELHSLNSITKMIKMIFLFVFSVLFFRQKEIKWNHNNICHDLESRNAAGEGRTFLCLSLFVHLFNIWLWEKKNWILQVWIHQHQTGSTSSPWDFWIFLLQPSSSCGHLWLQPLLCCRWQHEIIQSNNSPHFLLNFYDHRSTDFSFPASLDANLVYQRATLKAIEASSKMASCWALGAEDRGINSKF